MSRARLSFRNDRARDERGTVAIIAAVSAIMLFVIGAMAVDLGNAYARQRTVQASADFAALAGGSALPGPATNTTANSTAAAVIKVADYLNKNRPQNDGGKPCTYDTTTSPATWVGTGCVTPAQLVDGNTANGEVVFSNGGYYMTVYSPQAHVSFGLANVIGATGVDIAKSAEVGIFSVGGTMPFYVGEPCTYGSQQIIDTPPGKPNPGSNPTFDPKSTNYAVTGGITITSTSTDPTGATLNWDKSINPNPTVTIQVDPAQVDLSSAGPFTAVGFSNDTSVAGSTGYTESYALGTSGSGAPAIVDPTKGTITVTLSPQDTNGGSISNPMLGLANPNYWYVRLYKASNPQSGWTQAGTIPLFINTTIFTGDCTGKYQGNFGSLRFPRNDLATNGSSTNWNAVLALNTALGLQHSVGVWPSVNPPTPCDGDPSAVVPIVPPDPGSDNCVSTDTGNATAAMQGLISGINNNAGFQPGLLSTKDGNGNSIASKMTTCGPAASSYDYSGTTLPGGGGNYDSSDDNLLLSTNKNTWEINNDLLTCFFTDTAAGAGMTVGDVSSQSFDPSLYNGYNGTTQNNKNAPVLDPSIYDSPRFVVFPVLSNDPGTGTKFWPIIDYRAAFITDQISAATKGNPTGSDPLSIYDPTGVDHSETNNGSTRNYPTFNGIGWDTVQGLTTLHAVMINWSALPEATDYKGKVTKYRGGKGEPTVIRLLN